ncbi:hypothetical protein EV421DRAFT_2042222 [Armillaria borealis]|uniref:Uncharacterized protein n=1 Tax=Armillaria borealis TaxID=47425 RepID=A0AA39IUH3_9AGAR|nr:hypothetical protein EV421DRAFT_2042222 [Armillaria borealis]
MTNHYLLFFILPSRKKVWTTHTSPIYPLPSVAPARLRPKWIPRKSRYLVFLPRKVTGKQARTALEHDVNPFTKQPHSAQYKKILASREKLPVYSQMDDFFKME